MGRHVRASQGHQTTLQDRLSKGALARRRMINGCEALKTMAYGLLAIFCWLFLLCVILALPVIALRKNRLTVAILSAFLLGGILAGTLIWRITRPAGLTFRESLRAGLTDEGLREYGHPIEHRAEVAICLSTYAWVLGGGLCAAATLGSMRILAWRGNA